MADFLVITGPGASLGFRCAGVETLEIEENGDVSSMLLDIQAQGRYGLIAMEERFLEKVPEAIMKRLRKRGLPIIIPVNIPGRWEEGGPEESPIMRLIRRAIGYQIKLKR